MRSDVAVGAASPDALQERTSSRDVAKRFFDVVGAAALLLVVSPVLVCLSIGIKLDSRGPVLFRCRRIGRHGNEFAMLKFRKMRAGASGVTLTIAGDERFTRFGRFLAATKFDELPQLWNVLKGEMSLVGPRPEDPEIVWLHRDEYAPILEVRPGITGLCQLAYAKEGAILDRDDRVRDYVERLLPQKMSIDKLYATTRSFSMDLRILGWTVIAVGIRRDVAVDRTTARLTVRRTRRFFRQPDRRDATRRLERRCR
jgi:lipopolysaccharide/colanic/teichoic acid biosynthesis glycosyltransferase